MTVNARNAKRGGDFFVSFPFFRSLSENVTTPSSSTEACKNICPVAVGFSSVFKIQISSNLGGRGEEVPLWRPSIASYSERALFREKHCDSRGTRGHPTSLFCFSSPRFLFPLQCLSSFPFSFSFSSPSLFLFIWNILRRGCVSCHLIPQYLAPLLWSALECRPMNREHLY